MVSVKESSIFTRSIDLCIVDQKARAIVGVGIMFEDECGADIVIENVAVTPESSHGNGAGRRAIETLAKVCREHDIQDIRAVQILSDNVGFWEKCGFSILPGRENYIVMKFDS